MLKFLMNKIFVPSSYPDKRKNINKTLKYAFRTKEKMPLYKPKITIHTLIINQK